MKYRYQEQMVTSGYVIEIPDGDGIFNVIDTVQIKIGTSELMSKVAWLERAKEPWEE